MRTCLINCPVQKGQKYYMADTITALSRVVGRSTLTGFLPPEQGEMPTYWYPEHEASHLSRVPVGIDKEALTSVEELTPSLVEDDYFNKLEPMIKDDKAQEVIAELKHHLALKDAAIDALIQDSHLFSAEDYLTWKKAKYMVTVQENDVIGYFLKDASGNVRAILENCVRNKIQPQEIARLFNPKD